MRPVLAIALSLAVSVAVGTACSARSIVIGGDPLDGPGATGDAAGSLPGDDGSPSGDSGATPSGDSGAVPSYPVGGASTASGGAPVIGGTSSTSGGLGGRGGSAEGGEGSGIDPFPEVHWEDGQGYRSSCPEWPDGWGFTCWNVTRGQTRSCTISGDPFCNACSCAVPCENTDCPLAITGEATACLSTETTAPSCFITCAYQACPTGMTCANYPGTETGVCIWVESPLLPPK